MPTRRLIHVVDDDDGDRESTALLLERAGYTVFTYASGIEFLEKLDVSIPACVLLDIHMPGLNGLQVQGNLLERGMTSPVIGVTGHGDVSIAVQAMKNGAFDFLEKPYLNEVLLGAVADAFKKLEASTEDRATTDQARARIARLTGRELEVMRALLAGLPNKLIAHELDISVRTVEVYRANLMMKLDARSLSTAVRIALTARVEPLMLGTTSSGARLLPCSPLR